MENRFAGFIRRQWIWFWLFLAWSLIEIDRFGKHKWQHLYLTLHSIFFFVSSIIGWLVSSCINSFEMDQFNYYSYKFIRCDEYFSQNCYNLQCSISISIYTKNEWVRQKWNDGMYYYHFVMKWRKFKIEKNKDSVDVSYMSRRVYISYSGESWTFSISLSSSISTSTSTSSSSTSSSSS